VAAADALSALSLASSSSFANPFLILGQASASSPFQIPMPMIKGIVEFARSGLAEAPSYRRVRHTLPRPVALEGIPLHLMAVMAERNSRRLSDRGREEAAGHAAQPRT
jgi:hypothetical protein